MARTVQADILITGVFSGTEKLLNMLHYGSEIFEFKPPILFWNSSPNASDLFIYYFLFSIYKLQKQRHTLLEYSTNEPGSTTSREADGLSKDFFSLNFCLKINLVQFQWKENPSRLQFYFLSGYLPTGNTLQATVIISFKTGMGSCPDKI